jgi:RNA polymerase sigma-70 factor (ECF subfamily)
MADGSDRHSRYIELLTSHQSRLFTFLYAHVLNMADAEDLYQQVAMVLWQKFDQFIPGTDFGAWAIRVADLTIKNFLRGKRRSKVYFSDEVIQRIEDFQTSLPLQQVTARSEALQGCLGRLSPADRELVEQCYGTEAKIKEIADNVGRSAGAIYTSLCRIRQALLACIERALASEAK